MSMQFTHSEYVRDLNSTTAFTITKFPINPGLPDLFPFLSQLANNFDQYYFTSLRFFFKSQSSNALNSTNTNLGSLIFGINYDVLDNDWTSKFEMNNYVGTVSCAPSQSMAIAAQKAAYPILYLRSSAPPADADLRLYDHANFFVASDGSQATAQIGELWVGYSVVLLKPKLYDTLGWDNDSVYVGSTTGITAAAPYGTGQVTQYSTFDKIEVNIVPGAVPTNGFDIGFGSNTIYISGAYAGGYFEIENYIFGTAAAVTYDTPILVNCNFLTYYYAAGGAALSTNQSSPTSGVSSSSRLMRATFKVNSDVSIGGYATITGTGIIVIPTSASSSGTIVRMLPPVIRSVGL